MKIALTSVSDINNYGDLLFPFIARQELSRRIPKAQFRFFTPTDTVLEKTRFYKYSRESMQEFNPDAILTIGGEVIHKYNNAVWRDMYHGAVDNPSDAIFDWLKLEDVFKAWFSVGALDLGVTEAEITDDEIASLDYIGVRGILSKKILEHHKMCDYNSHINIVPDIGWIFPRYFKKYKLTLWRISRKYKFNVRDGKYFVFNINWTSVPEDKIPEILNKLACFASKKKLNVIIIGVITSYRAVAFDIGKWCREHTGFLYLKDLNLKDTGALLMGARFFIGSSLHCAITTMANGRPASVIHTSRLSKLQDLFGHAMMSEFLAYDWDSMDDMLRKLYRFNREQKHVLRKYVAFMQACFDRKLNELTKKMLKRCR